MLMEASIWGSVGRGGKNRVTDVVTVQKLLNKNLTVIAPLAALNEDGTCGSLTIGAIEAFQYKVVKIPYPDGRVDPGGNTLRVLNGGSILTMSGLHRLVALPNRNTLNRSVLPVNNTLMTKLFGAPRVAGDYNQAGKPLTNPRLLRSVSTMNVGPFRVTGLTQAVLSLTRVMMDVQRLQPDVYKLLGNAGMLVVRFVRGSTKNISNHSWGTAVDLTLGGQLDIRGDNQVQYGLTLLAPIFNEHGWYWGASFRTEDAMHFEAGRHLVEGWAGLVT